MAMERDKLELIQRTVGELLATLPPDPPPPVELPIFTAITDREPKARPELPTLGPAGSSYMDPVFGCRVYRVTDAATYGNGKSFVTPSAPNQMAWSSDGRFFCLATLNGEVLLFAFDPSSAGIRFVGAVPFNREAAFSRVRPGVLIGSRYGHAIIEHDCEAKATRTLLDLEVTDSELTAGARKYMGSVYTAGGVNGMTETVAALYGGSKQDQHMKVMIFDALDPSKQIEVNTLRKTVNGQPWEVDGEDSPGFLVHSIALDASGRYLEINPAGTSRVIWFYDIQENRFKQTTRHAGGHYALGYGHRVSEVGDSKLQWQFRSLAFDQLDETRDLVIPSQRRTDWNVADHPNWGNARPDQLVPFISAVYRPLNAEPPYAWDNEIVAVRTDGKESTVWRFCHHRSDTTSFWFTPRPQTSPDGKWCLFTSNMEGALGAGRCDVFLVRLERE